MNKRTVDSKHENILAEERALTSPKVGSSERFRGAWSTFGGVPQLDGTCASKLDCGESGKEPDFRKSINLRGHFSSTTNSFVV